MRERQEDTKEESQEARKVNLSLPVKVLHSVGVETQGKKTNDAATPFFSRGKAHGRPRDCVMTKKDARQDSLGYRDEERNACESGDGESEN